MIFAYLILLVALLNLFLGYAAAAYLGYGPPEVFRLRTSMLRRKRNAGGTATPKTAAATAGADGLSQDVGCSEEHLPTGIPAIEEVLDDDPADSLDVEPCFEPYDDDVAELINLDRPEVWDLSEKFVETSILKLNIAMMKSGKRAAQIDSRLRGCPDRETIRRCAAELLEDCQAYLLEQREAAERFCRRIGDLGELQILGEEIEMANLEQSAQVETTIGNLRDLDIEADPEAARQRLLAELDQLRTARHKLRDNQEMAFLTIARYEGRMEKIEKRLYNDPLTKLRNRIGLEAMLWEWWQQGRHQSRQMAAALFDLDGFGKVNRQFGPLVGDRILIKLAALIQQQLSPADLVGRYGGQRFLIVLMDVGPRSATKTSELIRQTIERTTFTHDGSEIRITATAGIVEVVPGDTHETVLDRLETALNHARHAGPNGASFHNGREPERVHSPSFGAAYTRIAV